jgi:hypothetical protein
VPAATGIVRAGKNLQYAARYDETAVFSSDQTNWQTATTSGSLNYMNTNERHPFTAQYTGGYTWTLTGPDYQSGQFHQLFLTQGLNWRKWKFLAGDDASYLPQAPTTGFSGIPGIGEPIGVSPINPVTGQTILTLNTHAVENNGTVDLEYNPRIQTAISFGGSSGLLRYPNGDGLDTNDESGTATLVQSLDGRNALSANYAYSNFSYPGYNVSFATNTGLFGYQRKWTRNLATNLAAGPMYISSSVTSVVPNSLSVGASASATYLLRFTSAGASFTRGTNGGGGYLFGSVVDIATGNFTKQFGLNLTIGLTGGYERTDAFSTFTSTNGAFGGAQGTYQLTQNLIIFANYTGIEQSIQQSLATPLPTNVLNEMMHTIGFGIGFSPRQAHPRQQ